MTAVQDQQSAGSFGDQFVEVVGLGWGEFAHGEVVEDEHGGAGEPRHCFPTGRAGGGCGAS
jgi:hypothetical protein